MRSTVISPLPSLVAVALVAAWTVPATAEENAKGLLERTRDFIEDSRDFLTTDDGLVGVRPVVAYDSSFGIALGARVFDRRTLGEDSLIDARARVGTSGSILGELRLRTLRGLLGMHSRFERNRLAVFAGLNGETLEDLEDQGLGRTRYAFDRGIVGVDSELKLGELAKLRAIGDLDVATYEPGPGYRDDPPIDEVYDTMSIPGFDDGTRLVRGGLELELDTRSEVRYGTGLALISRASFSEGVMDDPSRFVTVTAEGRYYLGFEGQALVFRLRGGMVEPIGDAPIPLDHLLSPTGAMGLRGLSRGERRGPTEVLSTAEYRRPVTRAIDASAFVDYGGAFGEDWDGFAWNDLEPSVGVGLRHAKHVRFPGGGTPDLGLQLAWAPNHGFHLLFSVGL